MRHARCSMASGARWSRCPSTRLGQQRQAHSCSPSRSREARRSASAALDRISMGRQRTKARYNLLVQFHDYSRPVCIAPARSRRRHRAHPRRAVSAPSSAPSIARRRPRSRELLSSSLPSHAIAAAVHLRPVPNKAISLCMSHVTLAVVLVSSTYHTYSASSHELGCALRVPLTYSCILTRLGTTSKVRTDCLSSTDRWRQICIGYKL